MVNLLIIFGLLLATISQAADRYWTNTINQTGYTAGDTVHLYGTFSTALTITNSGTAGSPITFKFESGSKFSAPYWTLDGAITASRKSYITIDGQNLGLIECTQHATGTNTDKDCRGIYLDLVTNVTVQNLLVTNLYRRTPWALIAVDNTRIGWGTVVSGSDIIVENCKYGQMDSCISLIEWTGTCSNFTARSNIFNEYNHGMDIGGAAADAYYNNVSICGNRFDFGPSHALSEEGSAMHLDDIIIYNDNTGGCLSNMLIYGNFFNFPVGINLTAHIRWQSTTEAQNAGGAIFNNIFIQKNPTNSSCMPFGNGQNHSGVLIANNTFVSSLGNATVADSTRNPIFYNNLSKDFDEGYYIWSGTPIAIDYNLYSFYGSPSFQLGLTWDQWRALGWDEHSKTNLVELDANYRVLTNYNALVQTGTNLTQYAIDNDVSALTNDYAGNPRPATGPWTIGAYEVGTDGGETPPETPAAPANFYATNCVIGRIEIR